MLRQSRLVFCLLFFTAISPLAVYAQLPTVPGAPIGIENNPIRDTTNRTNKPDWHEEPVRIYSQRAGSALKNYPDTTLHTYHRRPFLQPWYVDLGNFGSAARSLFFYPDNTQHTGPSLGYHAFDVYRIDADSALYYNTTRPYTDFRYSLGSKIEQWLQVVHTQNVTPRWNFAATYSKISSQGYYKLQRTNHDIGSLTTHYQSANEHYELYGAFVYNKAQQDENGGITSDTFLTIPRYADRRTIPVNFDNSFYSQRRSSFTTILRDFNILLQHRYTWGNIDTAYNADSTRYSTTLSPRFSVGHRFEAGSQKYQFKNLLPDSAFYRPFFTQHFNTTDSVYSVQQWTWVDNRATLNGYLGPHARQLLFAVGVGLRTDLFTSGFASGIDKTSIISTYLTGELRKEALAKEQWEYAASARLYLTGAAAGNFDLTVGVGKDFKALGHISAGLNQQLTQAPYSYTRFQNQYAVITADLKPQNTTALFAQWAMEKWHLSAGVRNTISANYVYLADSLERVSNSRLQLSQQSAAFSVGQLWLRKVFYLGSFVLDNEIAAQQITGSAPLDLPAIVGRHQLSVEAYLFKKAIKVATGVEARYRTGYHPQGYAPLYNRFYYQTAYRTDMEWEGAAFFNFQVKRLRATLSADHLQTLLGYYNIPTPGYPTQELIIRFGFDWILVN